MSQLNFLTVNCRVQVKGFIIRQRSLDASRDWSYFSSVFTLTLVLNIGIVDLIQ